MRKRRITLATSDDTHHKEGGEERSGAREMTRMTLIEVLQGLHLAPYALLVIHGPIRDRFQ